VPLQPILMPQNFINSLATCLTAIQEKGRRLSGHDPLSSLNLDIYLKLGNSLHELGKSNEAIDAYENALAIDPNCTEAYLYLGNIYKMQKILGKAVAAYRCAIRIRPNFAEAYHNLGAAFERRVVFTIGVLYQTPHEMLSQIPEMIYKIIENKAQVRFDRAHFKEYGDYSLKFEVVYWIQNPDYNVYMDIQQGINLDIFKQFHEAGIEFAYPTQTLLLQPHQPKSHSAFTSASNPASSS